MSLYDEPLKPEFKVGQYVTYKPLDEEFHGIVKRVVISGPGLHPTEIEYSILSDEVATTCSGRCIVESKYYVPYYPITWS